MYNDWNIRYLIYVYDPYVRPELKKILQHTSFALDPIMSWHVRTPEDLLKVIKEKDPEEYYRCMNSLQMYKRKKL